MRWKSASPSKYRNVLTEVDGQVFHSKKEAHRYGELKLLEFAGEITELRCQVRFVIEVSGEVVCTYVADFVYRDKFGARIVEDTKGFRTQIYRLKKKLMKAVHGVEIREV